MRCRMHPDHRQLQYWHFVHNLLTLKFMLLQCFERPGYWKFSILALIIIILRLLLDTAALLFFLFFNYLLKVIVYFFEIYQFVF